MAVDVVFMLRDVFFVFLVWPSQHRPAFLPRSSCSLFVNTLSEVVFVVLLVLGAYLLVFSMTSQI